MSEGKIALPRDTNGAKEKVPKEYEEYEKLKESTMKDTADTNKDVAYMRQKLHKMGRESVHNIISRKDNLILSPDKPHAIQEEIEKGSQDNKVHVINHLRIIAVLPCMRLMRQKYQLQIAYT